MITASQIEPKRLADEEIRELFRRGLRLMVADVGGKCAWHHYWAIRRMIRRIERLATRDGNTVTVCVGTLSSCPPVYDITWRQLGCVLWVVNAESQIQHAMVLGSRGDYRPCTWPSNQDAWGYVGYWRGFNRADVVLRDTQLEKGVC